MQSQETISGPRYLMLSPTGMAVALAVLAFLRGLFAWPFILLIKHRHFMGGGPGGVPGGMPGATPGTSPGQMPPHMYGHFMGHMPWVLPALWLASIVAAAIAGAIFAVVYNFVVARTGRTQAAA